MSYEPILLINQTQLLKHFSQWRPNENNDDAMRVHRHLSDVLKSRPHKVYEHWFCITQPYGTSFNRDVRDQLDEWGVDFWQDN